MSNLEPQTVPDFVAAYLDLLTCACNFVETEGQGAVCWCGLYAGDTASWEYCNNCDEDEKCGMVYLRPGLTFPTDPFPVQALDNTRCEKPFAFEVSLGVVRCFPMMEPDGSFPDADTVTAASVGLELDKIALLRAIMCCESDFITDYSVTQWVPVGPQGGCVSGEWSVILAVH